jgi:peptide/nickel transport system ATP-binding protein
MSTPILEAVNLRKVYPPPRGTHAAPYVAVDDMSFELEEGGSLGIVGESGAGKTTIARMLIGLEQPTSGTIRVAGQERSLTPSSAERKRRATETQIVFQDPFSSLDPAQSAGGALDEMLSFHFRLSRSDRRARVAALLADVGLQPDHALARPRSLSGGQLQRVAIARALSVEPRILVLDESVSALDVSIQAQVLNLLSDIRSRTGIACIFISHDLGVVRYSTDHVIVMKRGKVIEQGATARLLDAPAHPYTRLLRDSVPRPGWQPMRTLAASQRQM